MNEHSPLKQDEKPATRCLATGPMITGLLLVILGIVLLLAQFFGQRFMSNFWPFLFIAAGLIFYAVYFIRFAKPDGFEGMLFPGTYLIILGILFAGRNLLIHSERAGQQTKRSALQYKSPHNYFSSLICDCSRRPSPLAFSPGHYRSNNYFQSPDRQVIYLIILSFD